MVYLWATPENIINKEIGEYDATCSPDRFLLIAARKLGLKEFSPMPVVHFEVQKKRLLKYDCLINNAMIPLVNERVRNILEKVTPKEVQFFPAKVICADGILEGYSFLNVTIEITGIDKEKSIYNNIITIDPATKKRITLDAISGFTSLTYKQGCMHEYLIARDKEYHSHLLVSEQLKILFDKEKITGVRLVCPEEFYGPLKMI